MRTHLLSGRDGWLNRLDYKRLILSVFLLRFICACGYDIFVGVAGRDIILPDSSFYSAWGRYNALLLGGYDREHITPDLFPQDAVGKDTLLQIVADKTLRIPGHLYELRLFLSIIGVIYFLFGYVSLWIRVFNIILSIASAYLLFRVARKQFGDLAANLFLVVALFLPTQWLYSLTLSRDFLRVFVIAAVLWLAYGRGSVKHEAKDRVTL